jgi:hypothetical protein
MGRYTRIMRIAVVGGVERMESRLVDIADRAGHQLEFHHGHMSGPASHRLQNLVERSDIIVIVTDVNSHAAVTHARELARRAQRPVRLVRRFGTSQLKAFLN